jgi:hypothetical protein
MRRTTVECRGLMQRSGFYPFFLKNIRKNPEDLAKLTALTSLIASSGYAEHYRYPQIVVFLSSFLIPMVKIISFLWFEIIPRLDFPHPSLFLAFD